DAVAVVRIDAAGKQDRQSQSRNCEFPHLTVSILNRWGKNATVDFAVPELEVWTRQGHSRDRRDVLVVNLRQSLLSCARTGAAPRHASKARRAHRRLRCASARS